MEVKKIEALKTWPKLKLINDIQVFLSFANFYRRFIKSCNKIAALLTSMSKTSLRPITSTVRKFNKICGGELVVVGRAV